MYAGTLPLVNDSDTKNPRIFVLLALVCLFTLLPMVEIYLLVTLGRSIGWAPTILLAVGTGIVGASLAKRQGLATLARISEGLGAGRPPADALLDGALILLAGALLVTPGVLTDATGFALLVPPVRRALRPLLAAWLQRAVRKGGGRVSVWTIDGATVRRNDPYVVDAERIEARGRDSE